MTISLTPAKIQQLGELSKLRTYLTAQIRRMNRAPSEFEGVCITFNCKADTITEKSRGDTDLATTLKAALLGHYQRQLAKVDAELAEMGISLEDEDRSARFA